MEFLFGLKIGLGFMVGRYVGQLLVGAFDNVATGYVYRILRKIAKKETKLGRATAKFIAGTEAAEPIKDKVVGFRY